MKKQARKYVRGESTMAFILGCVHGWAAITAGYFREKNIHYLTIFLCDAKVYESKKQDSLL